MVIGSMYLLLKGSSKSREESEEDTMLQCNQSQQSDQSLREGKRERGAKKQLSMWK